MAEPKLGILEDEDVSEAEATEEATEQVEETTPAAEAAEEGAGTEGVKEEAAPPAAVEEKPLHQVPVTAILDERERRQKAEAEAERYRRMYQETQQKEQAKPPEFFDNPDERLAYERQQLTSGFSQQMRTQMLTMSRFLAEREFGQDEVKAAYDYFEQHPQLSHQLLQHASPYHAAVEFYRKQKLADEIGGNPDAYKQKLIEELTPQLKQQLLAELQAELPQSKSRIPGSLAAAPSAGKTEPAAFKEPAALQGFFGS